uniref:Craniofacial development protein 2-like n=1 Tax=Nicotiana tabacum TaxID=4097 RepID=A0A1S4BAA5_TOBAC
MRRLNGASGKGDEIVRQVPPVEKLFIGGDFNGHIGSTASGYGEVHGGFDFGERNGGGTSLLDFVKAFGLVIANSSFRKREGHLVTFQNVVAKTHIDYLLLRSKINIPVFADKRIRFRRRHNRRAERQIAITEIGFDLARYNRDPARHNGAPAKLEPQVQTDEAKKKAP